MSVSGVNSIGPDLATMIRLAGHGPLAGAAQAQAATPVATTAAAQTASSTQEISAQSALSDYIAGDAPTDASIGLYSPDLGANAQAVLAPELQETAVLQDQTLLQALDAKELGHAEIAAQQAQVEREVQIADHAELGAVADIDRQLTEGLSLARLNAVVTDMQSLLQAAEVGDAAGAAGIAASLRANLASLNETAPASSQFGQPVLPMQAQALVALVQSGDVAAAATLARAIQAQTQASPPSPSALNSLLTILPATNLSILDLDMNPLLLAVQLNMLIRAKATIEKLRRQREDHVKILPIPQLGEGEFHEDKARTDD